MSSQSSCVCFYNPDLGMAHLSQVHDGVTSSPTANPPRMVKLSKQMSMKCGISASLILSALSSLVHRANYHNKRENAASG